MNDKELQKTEETLKSIRLDVQDCKKSVQHMIDTINRYFSQTSKNNKK